jgi:hypothetical protein
LSRAILPFLTIPEDMPEISPWRISMGGQCHDDPDFLPGWDFATDLLLEGRISIDLGLVARSLAIPEQQLDLELVVSIGTAGGILPLERWIAYCGRIDGNSRFEEVRIEIPGSSLSEMLHIESSIVLASEPGGAISPLSPRDAGALLWQHKRKVRLEGQRTRFPITDADFALLLGHEWQDALWFLEIETSDLSAPFDAVVRLYMNSRKEEFCGRLRDGDGATVQAVMADVIVQLVSSVLSGMSDTDLIIEADEKDSLGGVVRAWIFEAFADEQEARWLMEMDRGQFHSRLNALATPPETST